MEIYLLIVVAFGIYGTISYVFNNKNIFIFLASIHLFVVQGLRAVTVGEDLIRYAAYYNVLKDKNIEYVFNTSLEPGYQLISHTLVNMGVDFHSFLMLISAFSLSAFAFLVHKYSSNPFLSYMFYLILGLYDFGFSGLRQTIAMAIFFYAFYFLVNKKFLKYLIAIFLAFTIHETAILMIIPYFIINYPIGKYLKKYYLIILMVFFVFSRYISSTLTILFNENLLRYTQNSSGFGFGDLLLLLIFIASVILSKNVDEIKNNEIFNIFQMITSISIIIQIISMHSYMFVRFNLYFYGLVSIFISHIYKGYKTYLAKNNRIQVLTIDYFGVILFTILMILFYYVYLQGNPHSIVPHSFYKI